MGRIDELEDTVKRCKMCLIPLGFKYARGINDLCWECGSSESDADLRESIAILTKSDDMSTVCDYCGNVYGPDDIRVHNMPDETHMTSCWPCAAECAQQINFEMTYFPPADSDL